ncbi:MAG: hypothetical protein AABW88_04505 [Nanoarchaeota archaeon]
MKRVWMLFAVLILLAACAKVVPINEVPQSNGNTVERTNSSPTITITLPSKFKLMQEVATRNPPVVKGVVKNVGNGTGSVKVTAKVYYAQVVADEGMQIIENVAPGEEKTYSIPIEKVTQWTSFKVFLE